MPREADIVEHVRTVAARVAADRGLEIFDVRFHRESGGTILRVQIDRPGPAATAEESVSVEDCAQVSRDLSALLDVEDVVPTAYTLEVSSPGLDRPLKRIEDYDRFSGRRAKVVVRTAVDGQGYFKGRLAGLASSAGTDDRVAMVVLIDGDDGKRHQVPFDLIARANLEVEF